MIKHVIALEICLPDDGIDLNWEADGAGPQVFEDLIANYAKQLLGRRAADPKWVSFKNIYENRIALIESINVTHISTSVTK